MIPLTVGSLFSGIGGFELGLERTCGFKTAWQCEINPFCLKVLEKHWPGVKRFADIKKMGVEEEIPHVDVVCGGFPCQPVSCAGKRKGAKDERWLWPEFCRVVRCVRPEWVLIENVPGLLSADSGRLFAGILRDLSESGYDAEWNIVSAASVGAPHLRRRVFIVAHCTSKQNDPERQESRRSGELERRTLADGREALRQENGQASNNVLRRCSSDVANPHQIGRHGRAGMFWQGRGREFENSGSDVADTDSILSKSIFGNMGRIKAVVEAEQGIPQPGSVGEAPGEIADTSRERLSQPKPERQHGGPTAECSRRIVECGLGRASDGLSSGLDGPWGKGWEDGTPRIATGQKDRVNRLKALGNAICPQVAQFVGWCLLDSIRTEATQ
ncbi:MAG: DNA (cytosine-5-)-methyltransferase [Candidatus Omnitrophica bacterium]|nr:DNA (cytosine-5-)-methyltransferase [Candidatus Omnitrophota bacterium]